MISISIRLIVLAAASLRTIEATTTTDNSSSSNSNNGRPWTSVLFNYDDSYITKHLDDRYPYLKLTGDGQQYIGPRDYFNFSHLHEPTREHLERVNLEEQLYDEIKSQEITSSIATMDQWHYSDANIERALDGEADERTCLSGLRFLAREAGRAEQNSEHLFAAGFKNQQTLRVLDSWGRPPSETYFGNSYWVGSYRGCKLVGSLAAKYGDARDGPENGRYRYCWAKIRAKGWPERDEMVPPTSIRVGVCLPAACNTKLANENRQILLDIMKFNFAPMHRARFLASDSIVHVYCLPKRAPNELSRAGLIFRIVCANWLALLLGLSVFAHFIGKENMPRWIYELTIQQSYRKFAADDEPPPAAHNDSNKPDGLGPPPIDLRSIGVVRFVLTVMVCAGHCFATFGWVSKASSMQLINIRDPIYSLVTPLLKSNDIIWLISGLLTSYTILSKLKRRQQLFRPGVYLGIILMRYLRLAPIQVLVLSFTKSVYLSLGEGPFWDYGTYKYSLQGQCQQSSWWRVLLFPILFSARDGNNYKHECSPVTWHIVADMKLSLLVPLLVYLLSSSRRWLALAGALLVSMAAQFHDLSSQQIIYFEQIFKYNQMTAINMLSMAFGETGYYNTLHRLSPLALGMIAGVYLYERRHLRPAERWPRWMRGYWFGALCSYQLYDWFAHWLSQYRYLAYGELPGEQTLKWILLLKPRVDCVMLAVIIVRLASDLAPPLMRHTKSLYKLAKVSYCVLLIHPMVISLLVNADESSRMDSFGSEVVRLVVCCVALSYLISFPLYILFESPLISLINLLFKRRLDLSSSSREKSQMTTQRRPTKDNNYKNSGKRD